MTEILRNIRLQFLTNNQFIRYFLFAAGEIILIILGILLALYIDNKNEEKHIHRLEKEYLRSIQTELDLDFENLSKFIENLTNVNNGLDIIIDNHEAQNRLPIDSITTLYQSILSSPNFRGHTETFESIESSGQLSVLQNVTFKHDYFKLLKEYEALDKYFNNVFLSYAIDINKNSTKYFALDKMSFIDKKYPYTQDAINSIMVSKFIRIAIIRQAEECHQTVSKLKDTIKSELETRFN
jgi:hypothetical protein